MNLPWRQITLDGVHYIATSVTEAETKEIQHLARGKYVLEIGSAWGYSAIAMALAGADWVMAVDPHPRDDWYQTMQANLTFYGVADRVSIVRRYVQEIELPQRFFQFAFIDGDHEYLSVVRDLKICKAAGIPQVACHDYGEENCPGVKQAIDELRCQIDVHDTLAVLYL